MSQENADRYLKGIEAYNRRDIDAFVSLLDPGVEWITRLSGVEGKRSGHAGVRSWWADTAGVFEGNKLEIDRLVDDGDWVVASGTSHMRGGESGIPLKIPFAQATRWRDGQCIHLESFETIEEALEAAGLSE
jgi:ketosteroid isomerase-like protein